MGSLAGRERAALCDTALAYGPDAPTLCSPWDVRALLAHLLLRERHPVAGLGIWAPPLAGRAEQVQNDLGRQDFPALVARLRGGPPRWHPTRWRAVDDASNLAELFIHHEDIRRGAGVIAPRTLDRDLEDGLWKVLGGVGRFALRHCPVAVEAEAPGRGTRTLHGSSSGRIVLRGAVGEVLLAAYGRIRVADVDLTGDAADVEVFRTSQLGV